MSSPQDYSEDFDEEYGFLDEEAGETIANPVVHSDRYALDGVFKLGHWVWHAASVALMVLAGTVLHDFAFLISLACGAGMLSLNGVGARTLGWIAWLAAVSTVYYSVSLLHPTAVSWWVMPAFIATIVLLADTLYRLGRRRLARRRTSPLDLSAH